MDIVGNVKEIADLAKKYNDIEFYRKIVHLEGEVMELTRAKREAEQKVEELQKQLSLKTKMTFKQPFYYQQGDEVPFCAHCFEKDTLAVHVVLSFENEERIGWDCPACKHPYRIQKVGGQHRIPPRLTSDYPF
jgi:hypothetical protein